MICTLMHTGAFPQSSFPLSEHLQRGVAAYLAATHPCFDRRSHQLNTAHNLSDCKYYSDDGSPIRAISIMGGARTLLATIQVATTPFQFVCAIVFVCVYIQYITYNIYIYICVYI